MDYLLFILISASIIIIPGPNVLAVVSTSISHGKVRGLQTVAGTSTAMIIQLSIAALATSWVISSLAIGFTILKWAGVAYLLYLGITHLLSAVANNQPKHLSASGSFSRGFWVSLTNPKTIIFFSAFLPQFVSTSRSYLSQIAVLSSIFLILAMVLDSGYALAAARLSNIFRGRLMSKVQNGFSGLLYIGAGATLASTRHGQ